MSNKSSYTYAELGEAPLVVGTLYKNNPNSKFGGNPLKAIGLRGQNTGGFRFKKSTNYCILTYTGEKAHWPDCVDSRSGIVHYYGDNHGSNGGKLLSTRGNQLLHKQHQLLTSGKHKEMKVFLIFEGLPRSGFIFRGLAVMGMPSGRTKDCLQIVKATLDDERVVDNYHVNLTLLDVRKLSREDIADLNLGKAPTTGSDCPLQTWLKTGSIKPLQQKD